MATSSWRLDDLQQLEELGLAGQLESTSLQEEKGRTDHESQIMGSGHLPQANEDLYTMSEVLTDLLMTEAAPMSLPLSEPTTRPLVMEAVLMAPTAHVVKHDSPDMTYINRGQWYEIHLKPQQQCIQDKKDGTYYKCILSVGFSALRMRNNERELLDRWGQDHPCERLLDVDRRGCEGVTHAEESESLNSVALLWQPMQRAILSMKINCLSSEFAAKKHGGEKGVLLQVYIDVYSVSHEEREIHLQRSGCNVKVFKDKGGDRKQKQDQLKMEKLSPTEHAKYQPSKDVSHFSLMATGDQLPLLTSPHSSPGPQAHPPHPHSSPISPLVTNQSSDLGMMSSIKEAHHWLAAHYFSSYLSLFASYNGADLLRLSRRDLVELCGPADGIRLFNALRSRTLRTVYVCLEGKTVYQALCLEQLTAQEVLCKLAEKAGLKPCQVSCVLQLTSSGILVMVDDTVVQNLCDEESFALSAVKDETSTYHLLLRCQSPVQTTPLSIAGRNSYRLDSSLDLS